MSVKKTTFGTENWGHGTEKRRVGTEIGERFWYGDRDFRSQQAVFWSGSAENCGKARNSCPFTAYFTTTRPTRWVGTA